MQCREGLPQVGVLKIVQLPHLVMVAQLWDGTVVMVMWGRVMECEVGREDIAERVWSVGVAEGVWSVGMAEGMWPMGVVERVWQLVRGLGR